MEDFIHIKGVINKMLKNLINKPNPFQIGDVQLIETDLSSLSPQVLFNTIGCYMSSEMHPCEEDTKGKLEIMNYGDSGECSIAVQFKGENYWLWSGNLNTNQGVILQINTHFQPEDFPESEIVNIIFFAGYPVNETEMVVTDQIGFEIFVYVAVTNWTQIAIISGIAITSVGLIYYIIKSRRAPYYG